MAGRQYPAERFIFPGLVDTLNRRPDYRDVFPLGASLADWATWSA